MRSDDLRAQSVYGLLTSYVSVMHLLRARGVTRTFNSPVADITEWLVIKKLRLSQTPNSEKWFDALDTEGKKYQIKGRWIAGRNKSTQLSAIRDLDSKPFDFLVAVVFDADFLVDYAAIIPWELVQAKSKPVARTNSHRFMFPRSLLSTAGVRDITEELLSFPPT